MLMYLYVDKRPEENQQHINRDSSSMAILISFLYLSELSNMSMMNIYYCKFTIGGKIKSRLKILRKILPSHWYKLYK